MIELILFLRIYSRRSLWFKKIAQLARQIHLDGRHHPVAAWRLK